MKWQLGRLASAAAIGIVATASVALAADPPKSIKIGYVVSLSGVNAQGAAVTTLPAYKLWVDDVNKKGGLMVKEFNKRIPVEVVEYDDTSNAEAAVRLTERLMTQDKVDFVLPPWSTGFNLAVAPVYARNGYPHLAVTANSNDAANLVKQMPTLFFFLNEPRNFGGALVEVLGKLKGENKINNKLVMFNVADQFGAEASSGVAPVLKNAGFEIVVSKSYPLGAADLTNEIKEAKASGADTFIAYSYPPDTFMLTNTAITQGYNPKIFYTAVGTAFAAYGANFKEKANGVLGLGGWDPSLPGAQEYVQRQMALLNRAADGWAAPVTYASLQVLEQAIEKAGTLDRKKVLDAVENGGPYQTIVGPVDLKSHIRGKQWGVGQWQNGQFVGIAPADLPGAKPIIFPKPAW
ncbi:MAG TPA: amino acid ABC transporter substrate-binding protein [Xanthobacteraceae bacterium]|jgi:branched-chain amino acid transport system substrate-binding protein|nr:amino acid ABC transporter substrate-binding protein [Xanthobacteraceae bacterium]